MPGCNHSRQHIRKGVTHHVVSFVRCPWIDRNAGSRSQAGRT
jgi:hypothetical protein